MRLCPLLRDAILLESCPKTTIAVGVRGRRQVKPVPDVGKLLGSPTPDVLLHQPGLSSCWQTEMVRSYDYFNAGRRGRVS